MVCLFICHNNFWNKFLEYFVLSHTPNRSEYSIFVGWHVGLEVTSEYRDSKTALRPITVDNTFYFDNMNPSEIHIGGKIQNIHGLDEAKTFCNVCQKAYTNTEGLRLHNEVKYEGLR